jgi:hypothetical protein
MFVGKARCLSHSVEHFSKLSKTTGAVFTKTFFFVSYERAKKARVFVPGKPFQPSLMYLSKDGAYLDEATFRCSTYV